ncbi:NLPA lipoprotein domain protein [Burkholderia cenocepacia K56-2Valvano]|nr:NLPA lipoprotein domain protein [Burkholderia cenocepacia K56-2Valvano]
MLHPVFSARFSAGRLARLVTAALLGVVLLNGARADTAPLKVGISTSPQIEALKIAAKEAKEQGLDVKIVEFTDWNTPNAALANKDIDVNYFQHIPFLENAKKQGGYNFISIAPGTIMKIGLYSKKVKSFAELKDGARASRSRTIRSMAGAGCCCCSARGSSR